MTQQDIIRMLRSILSMLESADEPRWTLAIGRHIANFQAARPESAEYRTAVRQALKLFGGMGSFQDIVLQNVRGVVPEQQRFDEARHELFVALRDELR